MHDVLTGILCTFSLSSSTTYDGALIFVLPSGLLLCELAWPTQELRSHFAGRTSNQLKSLASAGWHC